MPKYLRTWCNIKVIFERTYGVKAGGMVNMLKRLKLKLDGRHHSGIDDSFNIAKIADAIIKDGGKFVPTNR